MCLTPHEGEEGGTGYLEPLHAGRRPLSEESSLKVLDTVHKHSEPTLDCFPYIVQLQDASL